MGPAMPPKGRDIANPGIMQSVDNSGGGKSLLARQMGEHFRLPYVEIDTILWQQG
jgi:hypothetical protein